MQQRHTHTHTHTQQKSLQVRGQKPAFLPCAQGTQSKKAQIQVQTTELEQRGGGEEGDTRNAQSKTAEKRGQWSEGFFEFELETLESKVKEPF